MYARRQTEWQHQAGGGGGGEGGGSHRHWQVMVVVVVASPTQPQGPQPLGAHAAPRGIAASACWLQHPLVVATLSPGRHLGGGGSHRQVMVVAPSVHTRCRGQLRAAAAPAPGAVLHCPSLRERVACSRMLLLKPQHSGQFYTQQGWGGGFFRPSQDHRGGWSGAWGDPSGVSDRRKSPHIFRRDLL